VAGSRARAAAGKAVVELGETRGFRDAPSHRARAHGTIGFMMDCHTTDVEWDIALVR
jgi:ribonucleoside-diphosphate reductase alpha chain